MGERSDRDRDEGILPDDLDISEDAHVSELGDGRFVISPDSSDAAPADASPPAEPPSHDRQDSASTDPHEDTGHGRLSDGPWAGVGGHDPPTLDAREADTGTADRLDAADVGVDLRTVLREHVASSTCRHGFLISAKFDDDVRHFEAFSDDIDDVFGTLLAWYADQVDEETPVEDVLGILLAAAALDVRFPKGTLAQLLREHGVGPDDTVADLLSAVSADGGFRLPRFRSGKR